MVQPLVYCIDTSGLVEPFKKRYRYLNFPGLWSRIHDLIDAGRLVAPEEVYRELQAQEDDLAAWARDHKKMFKRPDTYQNQLVGVIGQRFPNLYTNPTVANTADPFVIALAQAKQCFLITEERGGSEQKPKIPFICDEYKIPYGGFIEIVHREGWCFP